MIARHFAQRHRGKKERSHGAFLLKRTILGRAGNPLLVALGALLLVGCTEELQELPEHAYTTSRSRWRCERGFNRVEDQCHPLEVPEHAFLGYNGDDWKCERGFQRVEDQCQSFEVFGEASPDLPEHAYLDFGAAWKCERGFNRVEDQCHPLEVPEHAFLSDHGYDWRCERGYKRADGQCLSLEVPKHAYLDSNGNDWVCDHAFKREGNHCAAE